MENKIKISLNEVSEKANEIRRINNAIDDVLNMTKSEMNALANVWQSSGSNMIRERFNHFSNKFVLQKETIDAYANFLDYTVSSYDSLESTITNNASQFN